MKFNVFKIISFPLVLAFKLTGFVLNSFAVSLGKTFTIAVTLDTAHRFKGLWDNY